MDQETHPFPRSISCPSCPFHSPPPGIQYSNSETVSMCERKSQWVCWFSPISFYIPVHSVVSVLFCAPMAMSIAAASHTSLSTCQGVCFPLTKHSIWFLEEAYLSISAELCASFICLFNVPYKPPSFRYIFLCRRTPACIECLYRDRLTS